MAKLERPVLGPLSAGFIWSGPTTELRWTTRTELLWPIEITNVAQPPRLEPVLDGTFSQLPGWDEPGTVGELIWPATEAGLLLYKHHEMGSKRWLCDEASLRPEGWWLRR